MTTKATWDDDELGFTYEGVHYTAEEDSEHNVQLLLDFSYWESNYKDGSVVVSKMGDLIYPNKRPDKPCVEWLISAELELDLYYELHPELEDSDDTPDISSISDDHRLEYYKAVFERGACDLQDPDVNCIFINDDTGMEIEEADLAQVCGYDPEQVTLICDG